MESLGLGRSEDGVDVVVDELLEAGPVLRDERLSLGVDKVLVGGGSMAEKINSEQSETTPVCVHKHKGVSEYASI